MPWPIEQAAALLAATDALREALADAQAHHGKPLLPILHSGALLVCDRERLVQGSTRAPLDLFRPYADGGVVLGSYALGVDDAP
jgi:hypothetical protein